MNTKLISIFLAMTYSVTAFAEVKANNNEWRFEIAPYIWGTSQKGTAGERNVGGTGVDLISDIDLSFSDILDNLDGGILLDFIAMKGEWIVITDLIYLKISDDKAQAGPEGMVDAKADVELKETMVNLYAGHKVGDFDTVDLYLYGGLRYTDVDTTIGLKLGPAGSGEVIRKGKTSVGDDWVDPIVGLYSIWDVADNWSLYVRADVGGFNVGSDSTWSAAVGARQELTEKWNLYYSYRYMNIDYDENDLVLDVDISGLLFGVGYEF